VIDRSIADYRAWRGAWSRRWSRFALWSALLFSQVAGSVITTTVIAVYRVQLTSENVILLAVSFADLLSPFSYCYFDALNCMFVVAVFSFLTL